MKQSQLFSLTSRSDPAGAEAISHKLLVRGGFIDQLASGIWSFLPLGWRALNRVATIIREEMNAIGGQEIFMPSLQPKQLWLESDRWDNFEPPLFKLQDVHKKELLIAPTHEEVVTDLARHYITSYKQLPLAVYQIQTKFRNELRSTGGLLRVREFAMKDLYSFHADLDAYYKQVVKAYFRIFQRCGLKTVMVEASSGNMGGKKSNEFMAFCPVGEDRVLVSDQVDVAFNIEVDPEKNELYARHKSSFHEEKGIEIGHVFQLGVRYSEMMKAFFMDRTGAHQPVVMGCYGIGVGRLMAAVVETNNDKDGIVWPEELSPFTIHLLSLGRNSDQRKKAEQLHDRLLKQGLEVLFDDRDEAPATKLKDADLLGITHRLVIGDKTAEKIEYKRRNESQMILFSEQELFSKFKA